MHRRFYGCPQMGLSACPLKWGKPKKNAWDRKNIFGPTPGCENELLLLPLCVPNTHTKFKKCNFLQKSSCRRPESHFTVNAFPCATFTTQWQKWRRLMTEKAIEPSARAFLMSVTPYILSYLYKRMKTRHNSVQFPSLQNSCGAGCNCYKFDKLSSQPPRNPLWNGQYH